MGMFFPEDLKLNCRSFIILSKVLYWGPGAKIEVSSSKLSKVLYR